MLGKFNLEGISLTPQGVPQIEGTFDIDTDRTMNDNAQDKAPGKSSKVTITKDKGRLSKNNIWRIIAEAEQYKQQDEAISKKFEAKNSLESYAYILNNTLNDKKIRDKASAEDWSTMEERFK